MVFTDGFQVDLALLGVDRGNLCGYGNVRYSKCSSCRVTGTNEDAPGKDLDVDVAHGRQILPRRATVLLYSLRTVDDGEVELPVVRLEVGLGAGNVRGWLCELPVVGGQALGAKLLSVARVPHYAVVLGVVDLLPTEVKLSCRRKLGLPARQELERGGLGPKGLQSLQLATQLPCGDSCELAVDERISVGKGIRNLEVLRRTDNLADLVGSAHGI